MEEPPHKVKITLENLVENEAISHSLILVKGRISCSAENCRSQQPLQGEIALKVSNQGPSLSFEVSNGQFKCLAELQKGINSLILTFSNDTHKGEFEFSVNYQPLDRKKTVRLVYIIPKGGEEGQYQSACDRIILGSKLIQCLVAERLNEQGLGRITFQCSADCLVFTSHHGRDEFLTKSSQEIWSMTALELLRDGIITEDVKVLAFLSCSEGVSTQVACGRGHLALLGASSLHNWAERLGQVVQQLTSNRQQPVGYSASLGAALHELGHALDLVHSDQGIMSRGYEDLDLFFTISASSRTSSVRQMADGRADFHRSGAILLSGHPWLSSDVIEADLSVPGPSVTLPGLEIRAPVGIRLVELHSASSDDIRLLKFWDFTTKNPPLRRYCLNVLDVPISARKNLSILVQDLAGRIIVQPV